LDACALLAFLNGEKGEGYEAVDELFNRAAAGKVTLYMSIVNLVEVYYGYVRDEGEEEPDKIMQNTAYLPMTIIDIVNEMAYHETARIKGLYGIRPGRRFPVWNRQKPGCNHCYQRLRDTEAGKAGSPFRAVD
jgi:predicted nucleic acid-binding protein